MDDEWAGETCLGGPQPPPFSFWMRPRPPAHLLQTPSTLRSPTLGETRPRAWAPPTLGQAEE